MTARLNCDTVCRLLPFALYMHFLGEYFIFHHISLFSLHTVIMCGHLHIINMWFQMTGHSVDLISVVSWVNLRTWIEPANYVSMMLSKSNLFLGALTALATEFCFSGIQLQSVFKPKPYCPILWVTGDIWYKTFNGLILLKQKHN